MVEKLPHAANTDLKAIHFERWTEAAGRTGDDAIADFAAAAHLADTYLGLANKSRAERKAIAGERAARFATRFGPEALLRRAGVDALLRDLIARTSSKTYST